MEISSLQFKMKRSGVRTYIILACALNPENLLFYFPIGVSYKDTNLTYANLNIRNQICQPVEITS